MNLTPLLAELNFHAERHHHHRGGRHRRRRVSAASSWCSAATPRSARTRCSSCPAANTSLEDGSAVGFRIVKGGGTFVWPVLEKVDLLSLELLTIDVQTPEVYTSKGVPVKVDGVAQIKVKGDDISIRTVGGTIPQQSAGRNQQHRHADARRPFARDSRHDDRRGNLPEPRCVRPKVQEVAAGDMAQHGPGHRQLHHPRHPRQAGLSRRARQTAHRAGQTRRHIAQAEADRDAMIKSVAGQRRPGRRRSSPPTRKSPRRSAITNPTSPIIRPR